jgi:hypothetical protein
MCSIKEQLEDIWRKYDDEETFKEHMDSLNNDQRYKDKEYIHGRDATFYIE